jgi:D-glycero-alpha-D-manno-heptose-7-phosphate kinase
MIVRSKAPLRIGLAGGGTDVSPYSDLFGGAILNATINLYAFASIEPLESGKIEFVIGGLDKKITYDSQSELPITEGFELLIGVYNRVVKQYAKKPLSFRLTSYIEAPQGSGLGTSSTIVVAILGAFTEWLGLPLGKYDIAHLAYEIERVDLKMAGGKQDQYAATFGGINYMEFLANDKVIVNPLQLKESTFLELESTLLLYYTSTQRLSASIIEEQVKNVHEKNERSIEAMHQLKQQAVQMKEALLKGEVNRVGLILNNGWEHKKQMARSISNALIDGIYQTAIDAGANGGKISGAGGGGFMFFLCPNTSRLSVTKALSVYEGRVQAFQFTTEGLTTWTHSH